MVISVSGIPTTQMKRKNKTISWHLKKKNEKEKLWRGDFGWRKRFNAARVFGELSTKG